MCSGTGQGLKVAAMQFSDRTVEQSSAQDLQCARPLIGPTFHETVRGNRLSSVQRDGSVVVQDKSLHEPWTYDSPEPNEGMKGGARNFPERENGKKTVHGTTPSLPEPLLKVQKVQKVQDGC